LAPSLEESIEQLGDNRSARRRSAARRLGKIGDPAAGPALLAALEEETGDRRTWETQYEMIVALGRCRYAPAVPFLKSLADSEVPFDSLYGAAGNAVARVAVAEHTLTEELHWCLATGPADLVDGAMEALWDERAGIDPEIADELAEYLIHQGPYDGVRYWAALAARIWPGDAALRFLQDCAAGPRPDVATAARESLDARVAS
jgi:HEAT repeat protein